VAITTIDTGGTRVELPPLDREVVDASLRSLALT
jgi:hypothetical protein